MGKQYFPLTPKDHEFIAHQKMFFIASASDAEVNLSPKGYDTLRVLDDETLLFCSYPGSANRTERDIEADGAVTVMWCAFEGAPKILRAFCRGETIDRRDAEFDFLLESFFPEMKASLIRQIFRLKIRTVESSCGMSVPLYTHQGPRDALHDWVDESAKSGRLEAYMAKNHTPKKIDY